MGMPDSLRILYCINITWTINAKFYLQYVTKLYGVIEYMSCVAKDAVSSRMSSLTLAIHSRE